MKKTLYTLIALAAGIAAVLTLCGCKSASVADNAAKVVAIGGDIPYTLARNYFINNDVDGDVPEVITTQKEFEKYFGMAAVMGKDGTPTPIDFSRQNALCVALDDTEVATDMAVRSLRRTAQGMTLEYAVKRKGANTYTTRPFLLLLVDKKYGDKVTLKDVSQEPLAGDWRIDNVVISKSEQARPSVETPDEYLTVTFDLTGIYYIDTGCNIISGFYTIDGKKLEMGDGTRTMRACDNMKVEDMIVRILLEIDGYKMVKENVVRLTTPSSAYIELSRRPAGE